MTMKMKAILTAAIILLAAAGAEAQTRTVVCNGNGDRCWTERPAPQLERRHRRVVVEQYYRRTVPRRPDYQRRYQRPAPYPYQRPAPPVYDGPRVVFPPPIYVPPAIGWVIYDFPIRGGGGVTRIYPLR